MTTQIINIQIPEMMKMQITKALEIDKACDIQTVRQAVFHTFHDMWGTLLQGNFTSEDLFEIRDSNDCPITTTAALQERLKSSANFQLVFAQHPGPRAIA
ncbi:MAG: hypothetical protein JSS62_06495 [Verrucomicrobia bacterium]|nr:hypothetical protein [Verrucomicrobiota bacterium]MBS0646426.1 hypothetical protein [Verrucomicrobiota bacterium]